MMLVSHYFLQLQEFKKGPFYLREDTKKNVVPSIVFGAYELWPPGRLFSIPGHVRCASSELKLASFSVFDVRLWNC